MDFTLDKYTELVKTFRSKGFAFWTFEQYCTRKDSTPEKMVIMRHDVDKKPENALVMARIESEAGIKATYYFRESTFDENVVREIAGLGHEIGYHYETYSDCDGHIGDAIELFKDNLEKIRKIYDVKTISMHGSPMSDCDNRDLWLTYDYHDYGIIGEPYIDVDYSQMFYLTDTGRRWDGFNMSVRDKIPAFQEKWAEEGLIFHSTDEIISDISSPKSLVVGKSHVLITTHPQRWTNNKWQWLVELVSQFMKNCVKKVVAKSN